MMTLEEDEDNSKLTNGSAPCSYSDLLVKKVLAAKETLKKYLGNLSSGSGETCNNTAFRLKSTSFEMNNLDKYDENFCKTANIKYR
jgi:hypothetical protein